MTIASNDKKQKPKSNPFASSEMSPHLKDKVYRWTQLFRRYPHMFIHKATKIRLKPFQIVLLYVFNTWANSIFIATRGIGKTFLTALFVVYRCIVFPNTKCIVVAGVISQGLEVVEYIDRLKNDNDLIAREIRFISTSKVSPRIDFWNGSYIKVVASSDNSRGARSNLTIYDEFRIIPLSVVQMVIKKFRSDARHCGWHDKPEYAEKIKRGEIKLERNKEIYLTSAYYQHSWAYKLFASFVRLMSKEVGKGKTDHFVCDLPYQLAVQSGIKQLEEMQAEFEEDTTSDLIWKMEYEGYWIGNEDDNSWYKSLPLERSRKLKYAVYPPEIIEQLRQLGYKDEKFYQRQKKEQNEIRILFADIARKASDNADNDATAIGLYSCFQKFNSAINQSELKRQGRFMETLEGTNTSIQALRIRELFEYFDCDYLVIDGRNIGMSIIDLLGQPIYDNKTGKTYEPINCINYEEQRLGQESFPNAPRKIYAINASAQLNSDIAYQFRDTINKGKLEVLIDENFCRPILNKIDVEVPPVLMGQLRQPYLQYSSLIDEMIALTYEISNDTNLVKIKERRGYRKDRYSGISYADYFANKLEKDLCGNKDTLDDIDDFITFYNI